MPEITPLLWFNDKAEEAATFYVSVFKNSKITNVSRYGEAGPGPEGAAMMVEFELDGQEMMALNGFGGNETLPPNGGIALFASCTTQDEVDHLWDRLAEGGKLLQCGWLTDKYGFNWNIVPKGLVDLVANDDPEIAARSMKAMMAMVKLDINELRRVAGL